jgi:hypothetical protein
MSTRLKSSRPEIILTKFSAEGAVMKVHVLLPETHKYEWGQDTVEAISLTREQAGALAQDLLAFANEMEVADYDW